jgi:hypothetical protein
MSPIHTVVGRRSGLEGRAFVLSIPLVVHRGSSMVGGGRGGGKGGWGAEVECPRW